MILQSLIAEVLSEKMTVTRLNAKSYAELVAAVYGASPEYDADAVPHWKSLNQSNYTLWKRLLSRIDIIFTSENPDRDSITVAGKPYKVIKHNDPYETQQQMRDDVINNKRLLIMIDHSEHPVFSVEDNIVFRTVHDYIVHILGNKPFGLYGELQAYNLHAKMVPVDARPAIFTEVVEQISWEQIHGEFPKQKVVVLQGFDFVNVGNVDMNVLKQHYQISVGRGQQ